MKRRRDVGGALIGAVVLGAVGTWQGIAWAEPEQAAEPVDVVEGAPAGTTTGPVVEEAQRLRRLKEEDPEAFRRAVQERKAQLRQRMARLKETDPEAYRQAQERLKAHRRESLRRLREQDPERFRELTQRHRAKVQEKLAYMKAHNPERYEALMQQRQAWRQQRFEEFKQDHPEAVEQFKANHPEWSAHHPEHRRDKGHVDHGVRDHGQGVGRGNGQGGAHRR